MRSSLVVSVASCGLSLRLGTAAAVVPAVASASSFDFTFQQLPSLGGAKGTALGINDRGDVVGDSTTSAEVDRAVLWHGGQIFDLAAGDSSVATAVNNHRVVVGSQGGLTGFRWHQGVVESLPLIRGNVGASANAINDKGTIVGSDESYAVVWIRHHENMLVSGLSDYVDYGYGVNNFEAAVGCAQVAGPVTRVAIVYTSAGNQYLPSAVTGFEPAACAHAINDRRQVAGISWPDGGRPGVGLRATRWDQGQPVLLDSPSDSQAFAINDAGRVVGQFLHASGAQHAALWDGSSLVDLDAYLDPALAAQGWSMTSARAINHDGWIAGGMSNAATGKTAAWLLVPR